MHSQDYKPNTTEMEVDIIKLKKSVAKLEKHNLDAIPGWQTTVWTAVQALQKNVKGLREDLQENGAFTPNNRTATEPNEQLTEKCKQLRDENEQLKADLTEANEQLEDFKKEYDVLHHTIAQLHRILNEAKERLEDL